MNDEPAGVPHPPYDELRAALGDRPEGHAAVDDLHAAMNAPAPEPLHVRSQADRLRGFPAIEARIANWFESPAVQRWLSILNDAGL
ncbi:MAG: hypothetical protein ABR591_07210 [Candidatus Velthaea sp.]